MSIIDNTPSSGNDTSQQQWLIHNAKHSFQILTRPESTADFEAKFILDTLKQAGVGAEVLAPDAEKSAATMLLEVEAARKRAAINQARYWFTQIITPTSLKNIRPKVNFRYLMEEALKRAEAGLEAIDQEGERSAADILGQIIQAETAYAR